MTEETKFVAERKFDSSNVVIIKDENRNEFYQALNYWQLNQILQGNINFEKHLFIIDHPVELKKSAKIDDIIGAAVVQLEEEKDKVILTRETGYQLAIGSKHPAVEKGKPIILWKLVSFAAIIMAKKPKDINDEPSG